MYRYSNGQIGLADFRQPFGMNLKESNRWVKKAQTIPWLEIEKRYAALFTNRRGNVAKPLRLALGACIIQVEYGYSDEETALQIQENPYLQYFCGYPGYDDEKLPFDPSLMVHFRKRLTPEVLGEINEMIVWDAKERQEKEAESKDDDDSDDALGSGGNRGTMIVDAVRDVRYRYPITGIAGHKNFSLISIEKAMMNAELGFGRRVLQALEEFGISFEHLPTGIDTMCVIVSDKELNRYRDKLINRISDLCQPDHIEISSGLALIATVGQGMVRTRGTAARLFSALYRAGVNVRMIDQGSSELNIIVGVDGEEFEAAVRAIYEAFVGAAQKRG